MDILVLGGTGTMGKPLVRLLSEEHNVAYVSRREILDGYLQAEHLEGDVYDNAFLNGILYENKYDCIIDFIWYTFDDFSARYERLLENTGHYIGMSSGAVCANSDKPISEDMPRVLDICSEKEKMESREYHMEKARIEDLLKNSKYRNWSLIRPHVTYNSNRIPLFIWEKEQWFYRVLQGHTIALTKDMMEKRTVLTYGGDVAQMISRLMGRKEAFGEVINIATDQWMTRREIVDTYGRLFDELFGINMKVKYLDSIDDLRKAFPEKKDRIDNDRMLNRVYDISKLKRLVGDDISFTNFYDGMQHCFQECVIGLDREHLQYSDGFFCAFMDRLQGGGGVSTRRLSILTRKIKQNTCLADCHLRTSQQRKFFID